MKEKMECQECWEEADLWAHDRTVMVEVLARMKRARAVMVVMFRTHQVSDLSLVKKIVQEATSEMSKRTVLKITPKVRPEVGLAQVRQQKIQEMGQAG
jgi:hypothetical protein